MVGGQLRAPYQPGRSLYRSNMQHSLQNFLQKYVKGYKCRNEGPLLICTLDLVARVADIRLDLETKPFIKSCNAVYSIHLPIYSPIYLHVERERERATAIHVI